MAYQYLENKPLSQAVNQYREQMIQRGLSLKTEMVALQDCNGRVTAEAVYAKRNSPHYNACAMDGIAVCAQATFQATETTPVTLTAEQFVPVDTGDPLPEGCDAVVMIEDVVWQQDGQRAVLYAPATRWQHVRQVGEDICAGDMILPSHTVINAYSIGACAAGGVHELLVFKPVCVGIIPTGDELIPLSVQPKSGEIVEFNSAVLKAMLTENHCAVRVYDIVKDNIDSLKAMLMRAAQENDIVLINAGSSAGRDDYTAKIISECGCLFCHGLSIRPGKPTVMGFCGKACVIGVPGYPVSAIIVVQQVVYPIIEYLLGAALPQSQTVTAVLSRKLVSGLKYQEFLRVKLGLVGEKLIAVPLAAGAGVITSMTKADGVAVIPQNAEGFDAGEKIQVTLLRPQKEIENTLVVTGSHDPLIDVIGDIMRRSRWGSLSSSHVGSMGGIMAILREEAHIAPTHLLNTADGSYNTAFIEKYLKDKPVTLIKGVKRIQGIMVAKGNPKGIRSVADFTRVTYANRQKSAGTRILLDFLLDKENINPRDIYGYDNESYTHTGVATLIASGNADAGLGIYSAAKICGLDFIPVCDEEYDYIISRQFLDLPLVQRFLEILESSEFAQILKQMGGYSR